MKKSILTIVMIALLGTAFAGDKNNNSKAEATPVETISVSGTILDFSTGEVLTGVEVSIEGTDVKAYTDFDGKFTINNLKPGEYNVIASFISYKKSLIENYKANGNNELEIKLQND